MRVGFLFNHDQIHQVAHSLPVALALAGSGAGIEVVIATTNARLRAEVDHLIAQWPGKPVVTRVDLRPCSLASRVAIGLFESVAPLAKLAVYRDNLDFFRSLDALVVAEKTSAILKTHYGLEGLKLIHTRHGAGDRAIGFNAASARFDLVLVSGPLIRDRLIAETGLAPEQVRIAGYPKFDTLFQPLPKLPLPEGRPTVLYNPHVSPHLSSWYRDGAAILDFFRTSSDYNLIFAPHVMLFERPFALTIDKLTMKRTGHVPEAVRRAPNILVDTGSRACTDMSYTRAADIYLGDVSSQVYEFLERPRPCIFVNSHGVDHAGDPSYAHWGAGEVIGSAAELPAALARATGEHRRRHEAAQLRLFGERIARVPGSASRRAAGLILDFLQGPRVTAEAA
ncbi:hypothetical protein [Sphingomonas astaxanthinifaciens]|uniref:Glycerophosphotransferase n=1 Tax=Sphingomonas astaxanthinifaciens DSM 22298 TaxID=1123267 RepID=A0ABQ5Z4V5_9SPHN|nr:hypothetical protein [Sphingomonas astaxanthinifaciens]GLR47833.1 glycerophosphotransferase [Sphingomonas astaxanthinifaciens DSM 22298]